MFFFVDEFCLKTIVLKNKTDYQTVAVPLQMHCMTTLETVTVAVIVISVFFALSVTIGLFCGIEPRNNVSLIIQRFYAPVKKAKTEMVEFSEDEMLVPDVLDIKPHVIRRNTLHSPDTSHTSNKSDTQHTSDMQDIKNTPNSTTSKILPSTRSTEEESDHMDHEIYCEKRDLIDQRILSSRVAASRSDKVVSSQSVKISSRRKMGVSEERSSQIRHSHTETSAVRYSAISSIKSVKSFESMKSMKPYKSVTSYE